MSDENKQIDVSDDGLRIYESGTIGEPEPMKDYGMRRPVRILQNAGVDVSSILEEMGKGIVGSPGRIDRIRGVPHEYDFDLYEALYKTEALIFRGVNITADHVMQPGFIIEDGSEKNRELIREWSDFIGLEAILYDVVRVLLIYGNAFFEVVRDKDSDWKIVELKPIPPSTMYVYRKENGDVIGYIQIPKMRRHVKGYRRPLLSIPTSPTKKSDLTTDSKRGWKGQVRDSGAIPFNAEEIIHLKINTMPGAEYGISVIEPMMSALTIYQGMRIDIGVIARRYASPRTIWLVGDESMPATDQMMDDFHRYMSSLNIGDDIVIPAWIQFEVLGAGQMSMDIQPYLAMLRDDVFAGLSVPEILMGGTIKGTLASATIQLESFSRRVKILQNMFSQMCKREIFSYVCGVNIDNGYFISRKDWASIPKMTYRPMMTAEEIYLMAKNLYDSNIIDREETRSLLSMSSEPAGHMALDDQKELIDKQGEVDTKIAKATPQVSVGGSPTSGGSRGPSQTTGKSKGGGDDKKKAAKPSGDKTKKQGGGVGT